MTRVLLCYNRRIFTPDHMIDFEHTIRYDESPFHEESIPKCWFVCMTDHVHIELAEDVEL